MPTVESLLGPLLPLFERERAAGRAVAVGILVHTAGSTYRKPGALMLIASGGEYAGLISGGCLEGDLGQHAQSVLKTGEPRLVRYDMRGRDDLIWGLGLGCEGAMSILLLRVGPAENWEPMKHLARCFASHSPTAVGIVVESDEPAVPVGQIVIAGDPHRVPRPLNEPGVRAALELAASSTRVEWVEGGSSGSVSRWRLFALPLSLPPKVLLLGAGPDAAPVVELGTRLSWRITVVDHRPAYADASHFPAADRIVLTRPEELLDSIDPCHYSAAVVMSHHLHSDLAYLKALAATEIPYVGLLGPAVRRDRLLSDLGSEMQKLQPRLHAPVGLALGGRSPESIALAIVAEIHAFVHQAGSNSQGAPLPVPRIAERARA